MYKYNSLLIYIIKLEKNLRLEIKSSGKFESDIALNIRYRETLSSRFSFFSYWFVCVKWIQIKCFVNNVEQWPMDSFKTNGLHFTAQPYTVVFMLLFSFVRGIVGVLMVLNILSNQEKYIWLEEKQTCLDNDCFKFLVVMEKNYYFTHINILTKAF